MTRATSLYDVQASELAFLRGCTLAGGAKNYQLWNHRRRVALQLGTLDIAEVHLLLLSPIDIKMFAICHRASLCCQHRLSQQRIVLLSWQQMPTEHANDMSPPGAALCSGLPGG